VIDIRVTINGVSFEDYWHEVFDELFAYADVDQSGTITDNEVNLLPSARAMRLALGSCFTPPIACLTSTKQLVDADTGICTREDLFRYYRSNGVGVVHVGHGKLPNSDALATAFIEALDKDNNGLLSEQELSMAESLLQKLDTNDDESISATELLPSHSYPGCAATSSMKSSVDIHPGSGKQASHVAWKIALSNTSCDDFTAGSAIDSHFCEMWSVSSRSSNQFSEFAERITEATSACLTDGAAMAETSRTNSGEGEQKLSWLIPMVDRDRSRDVSVGEIKRWLDIQSKIIHGQLLISVLTGGGLFEIVDQDHDASLSVRELRNAWNVLDALSCTTGQHVACEKVRPRLLLIASRGYPTDIRKSKPSSIEWFRSMDRNNDGDVSRREFVGATEQFTRMDRDQDHLISASEAAQQ
jgi:Ca2+-binding EF-hand superfamily protein